MEGSADTALEATSALVILYVEDNAANLRLIKRILRRVRPEVELITAADGRLGLELARERCPDLILLDLNLPALSGEDVLVALQEEASTREIPVVMVSRDVLPERIQRLRGLGAVDYLTKPIEVTRFMEVVAATLGARGAN